ncbi:hypothetical protein D3C76_1106880 [compost metagenome]
MTFAHNHNTRKINPTNKQSQVVALIEVENQIFLIITLRPTHSVPAFTELVIKLSRMLRMNGDRITLFESQPRPHATKPFKKVNPRPFDKLLFAIDTFVPNQSVSEP